VGNDGAKPPVERAVELFVYAPVGVALYVRDAVPTFVNLFVSRGRSEVRRRSKGVRKQAAQAKSMGEFAVGFGGPKLVRRFENGMVTARKNAETMLANLASSEQEVAVTHDRTDVPAPPRRRRDPAPGRIPVDVTRAASSDGHDAARPTNAGADDGELVIPDYDELSASQVVERLDGLRRDELEAVRDYESANRGRRTILYKIEQLAT
jgi:hypothetical protein